MEIPTSQVPSDLHLGRQLKKCRLFQHRGTLGTWDTGQRLLCGSQENEILLSALSTLYGFQKVPEMSLLRAAFQATQPTVAESPATFSPFTHFNPFRALATPGNLALLLCHCFFLVCLPAQEGELHDVRGWHSVLSPSHLSSCQRVTW